MEKAEERFKIILKKFDNSNIDVSDIHKLTVLKKLERTRNLRLKFIVLFILGILIYTLCKNIYFFPNSEVRYMFLSFRCNIYFNLLDYQNNSHLCYLPQNTYFFLIM